MKINTSSAFCKMEQCFTGEGDEDKSIAVPGHVQYINTIYVKCCTGYHLENQLQ